MLRRAHGLTVEKLESRRLLTGAGWFEVSGQALTKNSLVQALGDLDNEELFECDDSLRIVELILKGLNNLAG